MKDIFKNYWALLIPILVVVIALIFFLKGNNDSENNFIGMVDASSVDVAAEFPGRLDSLLVKQGDTVHTGQLVAILRSNEINAIKAQALAAIDAAKGQQELLTQGARPELIEATSKLYQISEEQYKLFSTTYDRMERLYNADVISGQEKDVFYFKFQAAKKEMETAKLNLKMLKMRNFRYLSLFMVEAGYWVIICTIILLFKGPLMRLFESGNNTGMVAIGVEYLSYMAFFYLMPAFTNGIQGFFRGMGNMSITLISTLIQISFRVLFVYLLVPVMGLKGVAFASLIGWSCMLIVEIPYYFWFKRKHGLV